MEWIQIPTDSILLSNYSDDELIILIKYQALYCQLEEQPTKIQLKKIFSPKKIKFLEKNHNYLEEICENLIEKVRKKRGRDKLRYAVNNNSSENSANEPLTLSKLSATPEKSRVDKSIKESKEVANRFEDFWLQYPKARAGSKDKAKIVYDKILYEKKATEEKLIISATQYAKSEEVKKGFAKGCAAWLNDDRFNNEYKSQVKKKNMPF